MMKAIDVGFVSRALGDIGTLLNNLANNDKLKDDEQLVLVLLGMRDKLGRIKEESGQSRSLI